MNIYFVYLLDGRDCGQPAAELVCGDDARAIELARAHALGRGFEVWRGGRRVHSETAAPPPEGRGPQTV